MDYNPRQITQMRWRDVKELEKILFISGKFNFQNEDLENVLADKLYSRIYLALKKCLKEQTRQGIIVVDTIFGGCFVGEIADDGTARLIRCDTELKIVDIALNGENALGITVTDETLMSTDNVKTLFGDKSIIGTGNIDLYNHFLTVTASDNTKLYINYPSSNNLECDSLQDLTKMTKAKNGTKIGFGNTYINYNGSIWQTANSTAITAVSDVVTTL